MWMRKMVCLAPTLENDSKRNNGAIRSVIVTLSKKV